MGQKFCWVGLTLIVAVAPFVGGKYALVAGAIIMVIGSVLVCLDK